MKELIENSLDAGADRISVQVQVPSNSSSAETSAGLFSIQVTDNGSGIFRADLELLCERHATSKLVSVGDLRDVGTFGFRGEALASCSQVGRVEVVTRSREEQSEAAWKVSYLLGRMTSDPIPTAGNYGTTIHVKDLFYGNRVRREALQNSSEEYQKILQVMQAYALNQSGKCSFSLSRRRDRVEMQTSSGESVIEVVSSLWNEEIGGALLPFRIESDSSLGIEMGSGGWASRTTFHKLKSAQVIIFLNGRLIEHTALRRALLQAFSQHMPTSPPAYPFIYVNLMLQGSRVDVNVHPSKRRVFFLDETEVIDRVVKSIDEGILRRQYETQTLKPILIPKRREVAENEDPKKYVKSALQQHQKISTLYPSQRVLTDNSNHRMDTFLYRSLQAHVSSDSEVGVGWSPVGLRRAGAVVSTKSDEIRVERVSKELKRSQASQVYSSSESRESQDLNVSQGSSNSGGIISGGGSSQAQTSQNSTSSNSSISSSIGSSSQVQTSQNSTTDSSSINNSNNSMHSIHGINSIDSVNIISNSCVLPDSNDQLGKLLQSSLVVGVIDSQWSLLQSGTNLLLCDMSRLNYDLFYSMLMQGAILPSRKFEIGLPVKGVFSDANVGEEAVQLLEGHVEYLRKEIGIEFVMKEGELILSTLPVVLPGQRCPSSDSLSTFLQRLCLVPDYENPPSCRHQITSELAQLYSLIDSENYPEWEDYVRHVVMTGYRDQRAKYTMNNNWLDCDGVSGSGSGSSSISGSVSSISGSVSSSSGSSISGSVSSSSGSSSSSSGSSCPLPPPIQIITNTETLYKSFERC